MRHLEIYSQKKQVISMQHLQRNFCVITKEEAILDQDFQSELPIAC